VHRNKNAHLMSEMGSWLCENSSARRAPRNISKKLRTMESNRAPRTMYYTLLENCIFYISQLYEFSHRLGQTRSFDDVGSVSGLPESGRSWVIYEYTPFCNGPVDVKSPRVIVAPPSSRFVRGRRSGRHTMLLEGTVSLYFQCCRRTWLPS
jgi:hypothetical protein